MYMTKPKQVQKKLSENTGKAFSVIMPSFTCRGGHIYGNYCTTKDEYSNVNLNTRVTSIAGITSFADYALPSQVLQPRLPVQSGGPAEAGTHQGRDDRFLSFFSKY